MFRFLWHCGMHSYNYINSSRSYYVGICYLEDYQISCLPTPPNASLCDLLCIGSWMPCVVSVDDVHFVLIRLWCLCIAYKFLFHSVIKLQFTEMQTTLFCNWNLFRNSYRNVSWSLCNVPIYVIQWSWVIFNNTETGSSYLQAHFTLLWCSAYS